MTKNMIQHDGLPMNLQILKQLCLRFYLTGCLLFLLIYDLGAQGFHRDIVYLKDGSIIKGQIVGFDSLDHLRVKTGSSDFFLVPKSSIKKFRINGEQTISENIAFEKSKGFINITQIGFICGKSENSASVETYNGYRFNPHISIGLASGIVVYERGMLIPVGIGTQAILLNKKVSPTAFMSAGKGLSVTPRINNTELKGGPYWSARVGIRVKNGANSAFTFQIGYNCQKSSLRSSYGTWDGKENFTIEKSTYRRMAFMLGFSF